MWPELSYREGWFNYIILNWRRQLYPLCQMSRMLIHSTHWKLNMNTPLLQHLSVFIHCAIIWILGSSGKWYFFGHWHTVQNGFNIIDIYMSGFCRPTEPIKNSFPKNFEWLIAYKYKLFVIIASRSRCDIVLVFFLCEAIILVLVCC